MSHSNLNSSTDLELRSGNPGLLAAVGPTVVDASALAIVSDPLLGQSLLSPAANAAPRTEIVFIESNVGSIDVLREGIGAGKEVYVLDAGQDGLQQMATILAGRSGIDALHLISHGSEASVNLGSLLLDKSNLADHQSELQAIGQSLGQDADILLYGCNIGAGDGPALVEQLTVLTGADIAASNDLTGSAKLGGDWDLEVQQGNIETAVVIDRQLAALYGDILDINNQTVTFTKGGNIVSYGATTGAGSDLIYNVNGNSSYQLKIDGETKGVVEYVNPGTYFLVDGAASDETSVKFSFTGGNQFTPASIRVSNYEGGFAAQSIIFTGFDASNNSLGSKSFTTGGGVSPFTTIDLSASGLTNVAYLKLTADPGSNSGKLHYLGFDDLVFTSIKAVVVAPTITSVTAPTNATYKTGDNLDFVVNTSAAITVAGGTPYITLTLDTGGSVNAAYLSGSGSSALTFRYTVASGNLDSNGITMASAISLNSATIKDGSSANLTLTYTAPTLTSVLVDGVAPTVTSVNSSTANGSFKAGDTVSVQVNFSEAVTVTGTPQLTLETGTVDQVVNYASGTGTSTLTFTYTVQAGDTSADLDYQSTTALALNSGTIKDAVGNAGTLTLAAPGAANSLGNNKALVIDTTPPNAPSPPDLQSGSDTGTSNSDDITKATTPIFTGTAESGSAVTLYDTDGTTVLGTGTATGGNWSITSSQLSEGVHSLTTKATDAAGNVSAASTKLSVTIDTTSPTQPAAPTLAALSDTGADNTDGITTASTLDFSGTTDALAIVNLFDTGGKIIIGTTTADGAGQWSVTTSALTAGTHSITLKSTDVAGNVSASSSAKTVNIDNTAPALASSTISDTALKIGDTAKVTFTFAEAVSGFTTADLTVANGNITGLSNFAPYIDAIAQAGNMRDLITFPRYAVMRWWSEHDQIVVDNLPVAMMAATADKVYDCVARLLAIQIAYGLRATP